jgi:Protein of unknown function (DUF2950)
MRDVIQRARGVFEKVELPRFDIIVHAKTGIPAPQARRLHRVAATLGIGMVAFLAQPGFARQPSQETFASAEAASRALDLAVEKQDERAILAILGNDPALVSAGDEALDKLEREQFAGKYREMHRLVSEGDGRTFLYIGAENWPFPIPIVAQNGVWRFDADEGRKEVLWRRIGQNEIAAIATSHALVAAERQQDSEARADEADDAAAGLLARISAGKISAAFHGYRFRRLTRGTRSAEDGTPGGVAFIAHPAAYRSSGVMTFIVGEDDVVYEKDLGPATAKLARAMTDRNPDPTWAVSAP